MVVLSVDTIPQLNKRKPHSLNFKLLTFCLVATYIKIKEVRYFSFCYWTGNCINKQANISEVVKIIANCGSIKIYPYDRIDCIEYRIKTYLCMVTKIDRISPQSDFKGSSDSRLTYYENKNRKTYKTKPQFAKPPNRSESTVLLN